MNKVSKEKSDVNWTFVKLISIAKHSKIIYSQSAFTCSKLAIETLEQGVKYVQS